MEATSEHKLDGGEVVSAEEEAEEGDEEQEEGRAAKAAKEPGCTVSDTEVAKHAVFHWPYRSWCSHCVRGRGRSWQHQC